MSRRLINVNITLTWLASAKPISAQTYSGCHQKIPQLLGSQKSFVYLTIISILKLS